MTKKHWTERGYQALPMAMVAVNGVDLSYAEYGRGKEQVMIMTHFYHETFEGLLEALADRFHIYALTARTTGKVKTTSDGGHDWTGQWAEDTVNFARHMGVNKFIFAGQSHGGSVGWRILYEQSLSGILCAGHNMREDHGYANQEEDRGRASGAEGRAAGDAA